MSDAPRHVVELAERRAKARAERDYPVADALRREIERAGWLVRDSQQGFELTVKPLFEMWPSVRSIPISAVTDDRPRSGGKLSPISPAAELGFSGDPAQRGDPGKRGGMAAGGGMVTGGDKAARGGPAKAGQAEQGGRAGRAEQAEQAQRAGQAEQGGRAGQAGQAEQAQRAGQAEQAQRAEQVGQATQAGQAEQGERGRQAGRVGRYVWHPHEVAEDMVHAQQIWDSSLAVNRLDEAGIDVERQRIETADVTVGVGLVVDGWGEDVRRCVSALLEHTHAKILAIDLGNHEGAGEVLHELAEDHHERLTVWHVAEAPHWRGGTAEWGACRTTLMRLDTSDVHVLMETSTVLEGDALTPLVAAIKDGAVAAGWKGVEPDESGMEWHEAGPGQVRALLGYLMAVRRGAALGAFPEEARYYRNADLELSLALEGPLVVPDKRLPVRQERHHGYHDVPADYRDKESRRTYDRVLRMLRSS
ncbi:MULTISPECIES: hypothetical protein [Nonomuraea]|uniref:DUF4262 domain-containing protein n=1 Tax=Nonomuraea mangrovi TaxID=2316207 RepID=A0ABW4SN18_9ACTN